MPGGVVEWGYTVDVKDFLRATDRAAKALDGVSDRVEKLGKKKIPAKAVATFASSIDGVSKKARKAASDLAPMSVALAAIGAGAGAAGIEFESGFAGIAKTVDATEDQLRQLSGEFKQLAKDVPLPISELLSLGEAAGQLGVKVDDVTDFAKATAQIGVATNLSAQEAAVGLARFGNIVGTSTDKTANLGNVLVDLGNSMATTESEILNFGLRIAGAAEQIGLSEGEILGIGAALSSLGIQAEAGGTSLQTLFLDLAKATAKGGKELDRFASVAGKSSEEFAQAFRDDAAGAIADLVEGLGQMDAASGETVLALEALGISESRQQRALLSMAASGDKFRQALERGNAAFENTEALTNEVNKRFATTASQLQMLANELKLVAVELFEKSLAPVLKETIIPAVKDFIGFLASMVEAFAELPAPVQKTVVFMAAAAAAASPLLLAFSGIASGASAVVGALSSMGSGLAGLAAKIGLAAGGATNLTAVLLGPWGIALAAAAVAVTVFDDEIGNAAVNITRFGAKLFGIQTEAAKFDEAIEEATEESLFLVERLEKRFGTLPESMRKARDELKALNTTPGGRVNPFDIFRDTTAESERLVSETRRVVAALSDQREAVLALEKRYENQPALIDEFSAALERLVVASERRKKIIADLDPAESAALARFKELSAAGAGVAGIAKSMGDSLVELASAAQKGAVGLDPFLLQQAAVIEAQRATAEETEKNRRALELLDEEAQKLADSFRASLRPMDALTAELAKLEKLGFSTSQIVRVNADAIVSAAEAQERMGMRISDASAAMLMQAQAAVAAREEADALRETFQEFSQAAEGPRNLLRDVLALQAAQADSSDIAAALSGRLEEQRDAFDSLGEAGADVLRFYADLADGIKAARERQRQFQQEQARLRGEVERFPQAAAKFIVDMARIKALGGDSSDQFRILAAEIQFLEDNLDQLDGPLKATVERLLEMARSGESTTAILERFGIETGRRLRALGDAVEDLEGRTDKSFEQMARLQIEFAREFVAVHGTLPPSFDKVMREILDSNQRTLITELLPLWEAFVAAVKAMGGEIPEEYEKIDKELSKIAKETTFDEVMSRQISTVFTDLSAGIADAVIEWRGFWGTLIDIGRSFARSMLRLLFESLFSPLQSALQGLASSIGGFFKGIFSGGAAKAGGQGIGGLLGGLGIGGIAAAGGAAFAGGGLLGGLFGGGTAGSILGGVTGLGAGAVAGAFGVPGFGALAGLAPFLGPFAAALPILGGIAALFGFGRRGIGDTLKDFSRDFGIDLPKDLLQNILGDIGVEEGTFKDFTKSISISPAFFESLLPFLKETGQLDAFLEAAKSIDVLGEKVDLSAEFARAAAGDFTALNEAWTRLFAGSDKLIDAIGGLETLLSENTGRESIEALAEAIQELLDSGGAASDVLINFWSQILEARDAAERLGIELPEVIAQYVEMSEKAASLTERQRELFFALLALIDAPEKAAKSIAALASDVEFLASEGATSEQMLQILGQAISEAERLAEEFGLTLPESIQALIEFRDALSGAGDAADGADGPVRAIVQSWREFAAAGRELSLDIVALAEELLMSMDVQEAQRTLWAFMGEDIIALAESYHDLGREIDPLVASTLRWALVNERLDAGARNLINSILGISDPVEFLEQAVADYVASLEGQDLGVPELQLATWDQLGEAVIGTAQQVAALGGPIDGLLRQMLDWALANADLTESNRELIESLLGVAEAASAFSSLQAPRFRGPERPDQLAAGAARFAPGGVPVTLALPSARRLAQEIADAESREDRLDAVDPEQERADRRLTFIDEITGRIIEVTGITATQAEQLMRRFGGEVDVLGQTFGTAAVSVASAVGDLAGEASRAGRGIGEGLDPGIGGLLGVASAAGRAGTASRSLAVDLGRTASDAVFDLAESLAEAGNSFQEWISDAMDLEGTLSDLGRELQENGFTVEDLRLVWASHADDIVETANRYRLLGRDLPPAIQAALDFAEAQGLVVVGLDGTVDRTENLLEEFNRLAIQAVETGVVTGRLESIIRQYGDAALFASIETNVLRARELTALISTFEALRRGIQDLIPVQKTSAEIFLETGEITEDLREQIEAAGGSMEAFERLGALIGARQSFEALNDEVSRTGRLSREGAELILQYASPEVAEALAPLIRGVIEGQQAFVDLSRLSETSRETIQQAFESAGEGIKEALGDAAAFLDTELGGILFGLDAEQALVTAALIDAFRQVGAEIVAAITGAWETARDRIAESPIHALVRPRPIKGDGSGGSGSRPDKQPLSDPFGLVSDWEATRSMIGGKSNAIEADVIVGDFTAPVIEQWKVLQQFLAANPLSLSVQEAVGGIKSLPGPPLSNPGALSPKFTPKVSQVPVKIVSGSSQQQSQASAGPSVGKVEMNFTIQTASSVAETKRQIEIAADRAIEKLSEMVERNESRKAEITRDSFRRGGLI